MQWVADYGSTALCCQRLTDQELRELADDGRRVDCTTCMYASRQEALWPENVEAWGIYRALCGRTVGLLEMHGWVFGALTRGWSDDDRLALLARLDVIHDTLAPPERAASPRDRDG